MKRVICVLSALLILSLTLGGAAMGAGKTTERTQKITAEIVSVDSMAKTITIKRDNGQNTTAEAADKAMVYIRDLTPGEKALFTCALDDKGEITKITKFKILKK